MNRTLMLGLVVLLTVPALPAFAAETLSDYLERAAEAEYVAQQIVSCSTPDGSRDSVSEISHTEGKLRARPAVGDGEYVELGLGRVVKSDGGGLATQSLKSVDPSDVYRIRSVRTTVIDGRDADVLTIEGRHENVRAELSFDVESGALVEATMFNRDGSVWCEMQLAELDIGTLDIARSAGAADQQADLEPVASANDVRLPLSVAGLERLDLYDWEGNGTIGYYSDGLFSFTILASPRPVDLDGSDVVVVDDEEGVYDRWFGAGTVAYSWESREGGVAIFGDVPLDIQARLLDDLPAPREPGVFQRFWRNLFD